MNPYGNIELQVYWSGVTRIEQRSPRNRTYEYTIKPADIAALSNVLESVSFFDIAESNSVRAAMFPSCELTAQLGGTTRTLKFQHIPAFGPLHKQLRRLMDQALIMSDLDGRAVYPLTISRLASENVDVPRPELIAPLLERFADFFGDMSVVEHSFAALARFTPPDQWIAFATNKIRTANEHHRATLLSLYASRHLHYSLPTNHVQALLPYLTTVLESYASSTVLVVDETTSRLLIDVIVFIDRMHYREAVPALLKLAGAHPDINCRAARMAEGVVKRLGEPAPVFRK